MYEAALLRVRVEKLAALLKRCRPYLTRPTAIPDLSDDALHELVVLVKQIDLALAALPDAAGDADDDD